MSYCGAQIFDAVGLKADFVAKYFAGTHTRIEGIGLSKSPRKPRAVTAKHSAIPDLQERSMSAANTPSLARRRSRLERRDRVAAAARGARQFAGPLPGAQC
jgi:glutamate synthase domain-containing protein 2